MHPVVKAPGHGGTFLNAIDSSFPVGRSTDRATDKITFFEHLKPLDYYWFGQVGWLKEEPRAVCEVSASGGCQDRKFLNRVNSGSNSNFTVPVGPFLCFAKINSAIPRSWDSTL